MSAPGGEWTRFKVLYTTQKRKKRKKWIDGWMRVCEASKRAALADEDGRPLTAGTLAASALSGGVGGLEGEEVELEAYLVQVDEVAADRPAATEVTKSVTAKRADGITNLPLTTEQLAATLS